jgi:D-glycero-D-manno-heptose 1,7-bisphosphate phosphatase
MARCWCRKPSPGLIIETACELARQHGEIYPPHLGLMVGDRPEDQECARIAGLDFKWAHEWRAEAALS